jgi:hypothetical protein
MITKDNIQVGANWRPPTKRDLGLFPANGDQLTETDDRSIPAALANIWPHHDQKAYSRQAARWSG